MKKQLLNSVFVISVIFEVTVSVISLQLRLMTSTCTMTLIFPDITKTLSNNSFCYSFKLFPHFWLGKTTCIIQHAQLLLTKFGKTFVIWNQWRLNDIKTVGWKNLGTRLCYFWWAEEQRAKWRKSFKNVELFWMNNTAIMEFGSHRIWRILQISVAVIHRGLRNSSYPTQPHSIIAKQCYAYSIWLHHKWVLRLIFSTNCTWKFCVSVLFPPIGWVVSQCSWKEKLHNSPSNCCEQYNHRQGLGFSCSKVGWC